MSEIGYIDGLLSTHFNECSIAAADVSKYANEVWDWAEEGSVRCAEVQPIGKYKTERTETFEFMRLLTTEFNHELINDGNVELALARHPEIPELPISLVAIFNTDMMLPIATFEKRTDGNCSFVQIGQEIDEDKLIATEGSTRTNDVESIRKLVKEKNIDSLIHTILNEEITEYLPEIIQALPSSTCRVAERYLSDAEHTTAVELLNSEGDLEHVEFIYQPITVIYKSLESSLYGHHIRLFLGQEVEHKEETVEKRKLKRSIAESDGQAETPKKPLQLMVVVRGNIGVKLAAFDSESGIVTLDDFDSSPDENVLLGLLDLFSTPNKLRDKYNDIQSSYYLRSGKSEELIMGDDGLLINKMERTYYSNRSIKDHDPKNWMLFKNELLSSEGPSYLYNNNYLFLKNAIDCTETDDLFELLKLEDRFKLLFDHGQSSQEKLVNSIVAVAGSGQATYQGNLRDRKVGKTVADIATNVQLTRSNDHVTLRIEGRPAAMDGMDPIELFNDVLRLDGKNTIDEDKAIEILEIIGSICVKQA